MAEPSELRRCTTAAAPVEVVWRVLQEVRRLEQWSPSTTSVEGPELLTRAGEGFVQTVEVAGRAWPLRDIALRYEIFGSRLGVPGLNLPIGQAGALPVGLELEGLPGGDERLLALGMAVEALFDPMPPPRL